MLPVARSMAASCSDPPVGECCRSITSQSKPAWAMNSAASALLEQMNAPHSGRRSSSSRRFRITEVTSGSDLGEASTSMR